MIFYPTEKHRILDCVSNTGIDVSGWYEANCNPANNPKYCFEWSYGDSQCSIYAFNVWAQEIESQDGHAIVGFNARKTAENVTSANSKRYHRALRTDENLALAFFNKAVVRMIVIDGDRDAEKQRVHKRELDPVAWRVERYDLVTGSAKLVRAHLPRSTVQNLAA